eukprot:238229-Chlamydomonas_euryale.AAC.4
MGWAKRPYLCKRVLTCDRPADKVGDGRLAEIPVRPHTAACIPKALARFPVRQRLLTLRVVLNALEEDPEEEREAGRKEADGGAQRQRGGRRQGGRDRGRVPNACSLSHSCMDARHTNPTLAQVCGGQG